MADNVREDEFQDEFQDVDLGEYIQIARAPQRAIEASQWATVTVLCSAAGLFVSAVCLLAQHV